MVCEAQHLGVLARVSVGIDLGKVFESIPLPDSTRLLWAGAVAVPIPASENAIYDLQFGAECVKRCEPAPLRQIDIESRGDNDNSVPSSLVPRNSLDGLWSNGAWQDLSSVTGSQLPDF